MNIKKIIREEMDDFGWIRDLDPRGVTFNIGDVIKVHNIGDENAFIEWLGDYSDNYLGNAYDEFITGTIVDIEDKRIEIQEFNMENLRVRRRSYIGLDMYYEILNL